MCFTVRVVPVPDLGWLLGLVHLRSSSKTPKTERSSHFFWPPFTLSWVGVYTNQGTNHGTTKGVGLTGKRREWSYETINLCTLFKCACMRRTVLVAREVSRSWPNCKLESRTAKEFWIRSTIVCICWILPLIQISDLRKGTTPRNHQNRVCFLNNCSLLLTDICFLLLFFFLIPIPNFKLRASIDRKSNPNHQTIAAKKRIKHDENSSLVSLCHCCCWLQSRNLDPIRRPVQESFPSR